jgi:myo-inositol catabolism protein IolS
MKYRQIINTEISVSEISFGCWTMGGLNWVNGTPNGWANVDEEEIVASVKIGMDAGVNHFDNADVYGNGKAERMLARVLTKLGVDSRKVVIASKVGHFPGTANHAYEAAHIRHQCEQSLINLKRDYIDIYYFHHGNFGENDLYLDEAIQTMDSLIKEGKVRIKGLSAYSNEDFARLIPKIHPQILQGRCSALDDQYIQAGSPVQNLMTKHQLQFVAFSPLEQGILLDKYDPQKPPAFEPGDHRQNNKKFKTEALTKFKPKLEILKSRFGSSTEDLASIALQYVLGHSNVACVIPGFRNPKQAQCNIAGKDRVLTRDDLDFIRQTLKS